MKSRIILTIVSVLFLLLQVAAEGLATMVVLRLNMLPDKYVIALMAVLILFAALTAGLLFLRGKKPVSLARRIVGWILAILIICGSLLVAKLATDAYQALNEVTQPVAEQTSVRDMYIFVRNDDPAQTYLDTADYPYGIIADYDEEHTQQAIALVEEDTGKTLKITEFERTAELADAILNGQVDAMFLNGAAVTILTEEEAYEDFLEKVRILHAIPLTQLEVTEPTTEPPTTEPPAAESNVTNTPFIVYLSGSDTRSKKLKTSRSDVNILVVVNPVTKQILMINTPRDFWVPNPVGNGKRDKLTHCGLYGPECSMEALGDLYDLEVDYYAQINFTGFETLVDAVGGVTVYSDQTFRTRQDHLIKKGENHLNGEEALGFARERYNVKGGDNGRGKNQMKVIQAIIEKMTTGTTVISNYSSILNSLKGMFKMSVPMEDISLLVKMQLEEMPDWNIQSYAATGKGGSEKNYSSPGHKAYVMYPDEKSVAHAADLVDRVIAGEILTDEDMTVPK